MIALPKENLHIKGQAEVLLPAALDHGFDYRVPAELPLSAGDVVRVPFGRGESYGVVWGQGTAELPPAKIKPVAGVAENIPPLSPALMEFIGWAAWYNCAPLGAILKMVLPVSDMEKKVRQSVHDKLFASSTGQKLASLSNEQKNAAAKLEQSIGGGFSVTLLDGVTGSGKTEVYFQAIAHAIRGQESEARDQGVRDFSPDPRPLTSNPQVLVLLPEISLSVQWLERFKERFGFAPLIWHSGVTPAQKRVTFSAIASGKARVIVGARSALFLPYKNLSMLVVDEEHDASFKQEDGVIYHARDMAVARARFEKIPAVLVSATPSLETYENARQGKYQTLTLPQRHNAAELPDIHMIDMRPAKMDAASFVSPALRQVLANTLAAGQQSLLFLNRRGYAPLMLCRNCGHRFQCPDCSSWLVLHKKGVRGQRSGASKQENIFSPTPDPRPLTSILQCHHCNHSVPLPKTCPACASEDSLHACGPGVERLHEEVQEFLPDARVAILASDQATAQTQLAETIKKMGDGRIDILIGTQMIAKGHHFPGLTSVGVVDADLGLAGGDLRAAERTYQLLHQLSGRAGREQQKGHVYLQSYLPEHPVMQALLACDRDAFFAAELDARKLANMPPFSRLAAIIVEGKKEQQVMNAARQLATKLLTPNSKLNVMGPAPAPLRLLRGRYRWRLLLRAPRQLNLPDYLKSQIEMRNFPSAIKVRIDIDPQSFM